MFKHWLSAALLVGLLPSIGGMNSAAAEEMTLADGKVVLTAPEGWKKKTPSSRIVEVEYEIPAVKDDERPGRMTAMGAGGSVEDNINRWIGQFKGATKDSSKRQETTIAGQKVHLIDITGTYKDTPGGPFAGGKTVEREDYRMLAAIISTEKQGNYFLKFYGPKATVQKNEDAFKKMVDSLKVK